MNAWIFIVFAAQSAAGFVDGSTAMSGAALAAVIIDKLTFLIGKWRGTNQAGRLDAIERNVEAMSEAVVLMSATVATLSTDNAEAHHKVLAEVNKLGREVAELRGQVRGLHNGRGGVG